jgi:hypothetical protein
MKSKKGGLFLLLCFVGLQICQGQSSKPAQPRNEYEVKAGFLFHLFQFVEWPGDIMEKTHGVYRIGIVGNDPFGKVLDDIAAAERSDHRKIEVLRFQNTDPKIFCHLFWVAKTEPASRIAAHFKRFEDKPILVVSDIEGFADGGGMVELVKKENRIRLRINNEEARKHQLVISSRLLKLAEITGPRKE